MFREITINMAASDFMRFISFWRGIGPYQLEWEDASQIMGLGVWHRIILYYFYAYVLRYMSDDVPRESPNE